MIPSKNCYDIIKKEEGVVLRPYLDQAGVATIGVGTTRYPNGDHVTMSDRNITLEVAQTFLEHDVLMTTQAVNEMIPSLLNQNQFDALIDFAYNEGTGALHGSTLLKLVKANAADPCIRDSFMMWDKIHKDGRLVYSQDLAGRRNREADLYFTPI